jgi:hypothetical protein
VKKEKLRSGDGNQTDEIYAIRDGTIAYLTRGCGGNVHDLHIVEVTSGSFEKVTEGANPHSGTRNNHPDCAEKNAVDLETDSFLLSAYRGDEEDIARTRNNWVCHDFKERRTVSTHHTIRTNATERGGSHLISWLIET